MARVSPSPPYCRHAKAGLHPDLRCCDPCRLLTIRGSATTSSRGRIRHSEVECVGGRELAPAEALRAVAAASSAPHEAGYQAANADEKIRRVTRPSPRPW